MWIVARCDWRWLRRGSGHLGWRHADAHNDPIPHTLAGNPGGTGIYGLPAFNLSDRLLTRHWLRIVPLGPPPARCRPSASRERLSSGMTLRLRPLRLEDENEARAAEAWS